MEKTVVTFPDLGSDVTQKIIGSAIAVHKHFGPGLLESIYEDCLAISMRQHGVVFEKQKTYPVSYEGCILDNAFRVDFLVENRVIVEIKSVDSVLPVHQAQIITYMRLAKAPIGLLINFNVPKLVAGIKRFALSEFDEVSTS